MKTEHTPTPWKTENVNFPWVEIFDFNGIHIATVPYRTETQQANAALIVRAVNNHEALTDFVGTFLNKVGEFGEAKNIDLMTMRQIAEDLLKQASK